MRLKSRGKTLVISLVVIGVFATGWLGGVDESVADKVALYDLYGFIETEPPTDVPLYIELAAFVIVDLLMMLCPWWFHYSSRARATSVSMQFLYLTELAPTLCQRSTNCRKAVTMNQFTVGLATMSADSLPGSRQRKEEIDFTSSTARTARQET